jgi:ATP-dependent exoDNAse (exonuclease V) alpha subunit
MPTETLQMHLTRGRQQEAPDKRLFIIDESSLTGTRQVRDFMKRIQESDRVIFVGDTKQHEAVEAGRPYAQLQEAGIQTALLDEIVRQKDPGLKAVVEDLACRHVCDALIKLQDQGRIHEIVGRQHRIETITAAYLEKPEGTLVVSPDNRSRCDLNASIHTALQTAGKVSRDERTMSVLVARQDMTAVDRQIAGRYAENEIIRYTRGSEKLGIDPGEYARITAIDREKNLLTVQRSQGESLTYDPRRLSGVQVYDTAERGFAENDRIQITAPSREMAVANRDMGNIERLNDDGTVSLRMDNGRLIDFDPEKHPHLDFGYAVTSYSAQGQTAERVLINIDTVAARGKLLNNRFAYVAVSRAQLDARIYTNDAESLTYSLARDVSQRSAITLDPTTGLEIGNEGAKGSQELDRTPATDLPSTAPDQASDHAAEMSWEIN